MHHAHLCSPAHSREPRPYPPTATAYNVQHSEALVAFPPVAGSGDLSSESHLTQVDMWHSQLDARLATRSGAVNYLMVPNVRHAATNALLDEESSHQHTSANVTGAAAFGIKYADLECDVTAAEGQVVTTAKTRWYYSFISRFNNYLGNNGLKYISRRFDVNATLNNGLVLLVLRARHAQWTSWRSRDACATCAACAAASLMTCPRTPAASRRLHSYCACV